MATLTTCVDGNTDAAANRGEGGGRGGGGAGKGVIGDTALPEEREREERKEKVLRTGNTDEMEER